MQYFLSSMSIKELSSLTMRERQEHLHHASAKLDAAQRFILNIGKLLLITPLFWFLARQEWEALGITATIVSLSYVFVFRPIYLYFCYQHLKLTNIKSND